MRRADPWPDASGKSFGHEPRGVMWKDTVRPVDVGFKHGDGGVQTIFNHRPVATLVHRRSLQMCCRTMWKAITQQCVVR